MGGWTQADRIDIAIALIAGGRHAARGAPEQRNTAPRLTSLRRDAQTDSAVGAGVVELSRTIRNARGHRAAVHRDDPDRASFACRRDAQLLESRLRCATFAIPRHRSRSRRTSAAARTSALSSTSRFGTATKSAVLRRKAATFMRSPRRSSSKPSNAFAQAPHQGCGSVRTRSTGRRLGVLAKPRADGRTRHRVKSKRAGSALISHDRIHRFQKRTGGWIPTIRRRKAVPVSNPVLAAAMPATAASWQ